MVGLVGIEPTTSRLSGVRSSHLSYRPELGSIVFKEHASILQNRIVEGLFLFGLKHFHHRKEVIQPQVLLRLPCYDFTPITNDTVGAYPPCGLAQRLLVLLAFVV